MKGKTMSDEKMSYEEALNFTHCQTVSGTATLCGLKDVRLGVSDIRESVNCPQCLAKLAVELGEAENTSGSETISAEQPGETENSEAKNDVSEAEPVETAESALDKQIDRLFSMFDAISDQIENDREISAERHTKMIEVLESVNDNLAHIGKCLTGGE
jgi:hypothetical protein